MPAGVSVAPPVTRLRGLVDLMARIAPDGRRRIDGAGHGGDQRRRFQPHRVNGVVYRKS
jgi:hypothetical protein